MVIYFHEKCTIMILHHFRLRVLVWIHWFHEVTIGGEKVGHFIVFDLVTLVWIHAVL